MSDSTQEVADRGSLIKQVGVLLVLFVMMLALQLARPEALKGEVDPLTLASIGFTALFAFTVGGIVHKLGLPRVTGYILTGVVLGPSLAGLLVGEGTRSILSGAVVQEMKIFNTLALGLIATMAGLELDLKATAKVWKTLAWTVTLKVLALLILVGGPFMGAFYATNPLGIKDPPSALAFALIFAVLGIGTSPAIALAVTSDLKTKGRLTDILLAIAVLKDVVVVACLAVAIAVARATFSGGGFDPATLVNVIWEIGLSIVVGLAVGGLVIAYIRFVHAEMLLFVVAMILVVAQISVVFHLELLLVFIVAGCLVRNASPHVRELMHPLEVVALPVFVVFFTTAGASIDLSVSIRLLPLALLLAGGRLVAYYLSSRAAGVLADESIAVRRFAWLAYIPQSGVTLGLVLLTARALPEHAELITAMGMALVALNLFGGPIALGIALKRSGEVPGEGPGEAASAEAPEVGSVEGQALASGGPPTQEGASAAVPYEVIGVELEDEALAASVRGLIEGVEGSIRASMIHDEEGLTRLFDASLRLLEAQATEQERRAAVQRFGEQPLDFDQGEESLRLRWAISAVIEVLGRLPVEIEVPMEARWMARRPGQGAVEGLRRVGRRALMVISGAARRRRVPMRTIGRVSLEVPFMKGLMAMGDARYRAEAACFEALRLYLDGQLDAAQATEAIKEGRALGVEAIGRVGMEQMREGALTTIGLASRADTPSTPVSLITFAAVEPEVRALHNELTARPRIWAGYFNARRDRLLLKALLEGCRVDIEQLISHRLEAPLKQVDEALVVKAALIIAELHALRKELERAEGLDEETTRGMLEQIRQLFSEETRARLKTSTAEFRHHALPHHFTDALRDLIESAPERLYVIAPWVERLLPESGPLTEVRTIEIPFRAILRRQLIEEFLPELLHHHAEALDLVSSVPARLSESVHIVAYAFELNLKGHVASEGPLLESVRAAIDRVEVLQDEIKEQLGAMIAALKGETSQTLAAVAQACVPQEQDGLAARGSLIAVGVRLSGRLLTRARAFAHGFKNQEQIQALRVRSGLERLSPARMRAHLQENLRAPEALGLPPRYLRLFTLRPLDDRRLFVVHKVELEALIQIETAWRGGQRAAVLVTGPNGSGKTSLLNMFQLEVGVDRLIRLHDHFSSRREGLVEALATELDCDPSVDGVLAALGREPGAVFISGLERWFEPTLEGVERLRIFQNLLVRSSDKALWVVSVQWNALQQFEALLDMRSAFSHHIELEPLGWEDCRKVIESRHQISGLGWSFKHKLGWRERLTFWRDDDDEALYFKRLSQIARGNTRAALYHHLRAVQLVDGAIETSTMVQIEVPFLAQLTEDSLELLAGLLRLGAMERRDLQALLMLGPQEIDLHLEHLFLAGLVEAGSTGEEIIVPNHLHDRLVDELNALERLARGSS